jgi:hypothetical protein
MEKTKLALTVVSVLIILVPIAGAVYLYSDNLLGLIVPPQINNLLQNNQQQEFKPPQPTGTPQYNPQTGAFTLSFAVTNPFDAPITISSLTGQVKAQDYNVILGNVSLLQPVNLTPKETQTVTTTGTIDPTAANQIKAQNPNADNVEVSLEDVAVTLGGVTVKIGDVPNVGVIPLGGS